MDNLIEFSLRLQRGRSIDDILCGAEDRQRQLISIAINIVLGLSFKYSDEADKTVFFLRKVEMHSCELEEIISLMHQECILSSKNFYDSNMESLKSGIERVNRLCFKYFYIINNGTKSRERAVTKVATRYAGNSALLTDIVRLTITPARPEYAQDICKFLHIEGHEFCSDNFWSIRPSGILRYACHINIEGFVAQIHIDERGQMSANTIFSHKIYETIRLMTGEGHAFNTMLSETNAQKIMKNYNEIMDSYGLMNRNFIVNQPKHSIEEFTGENLFTRFKELMLLHQSIHIDAICSSIKEWQELYCRLATELNSKFGKVVFSDSLLSKLTNYEEYKDKSLLKVMT